VHSIIREIDELGHSISTMRTLAQTFSNFVPKRLVQQLVETGDAMTLGGVRREVTACSPMSSTSLGLPKIGTRVR
jgi:adenylate cyclase